VTKVLVEHRAQLRKIYRRAYVERESGAGRPVQIKVGSHKQFDAKGIYLDLNFSYTGDQLVSSGGPHALDVAEAIQVYIDQSPRKPNPSPAPAVTSSKRNC
jgi:hypothetical protein